MDGTPPPRPPCQTVEEALRRISTLIGSARHAALVREALNNGQQLRYTIAINQRSEGGFNVHLSRKVVAENKDLLNYTRIA